MTLAYQPVMMARAPQQVAFHEGLVRLMDPSGRTIPARDFMESVETSQIGRLIDCASLELGLAALARDPQLRLSINMSARSIGFARWIEILDRGLAHEPTVAERLILEITEGSAMLMPEIVTSFMARLQRKGISFGLDDFGAGYTAFRYFRDFMFDMVKIDGQFVRGVARDPDNQVLVEALGLIARQFDMFTVAESVETAEDAEWLIAMASIACRAISSAPRPAARCTRATPPCGGPDAAAWRGCMPCRGSRLRLTLSLRRPCLRQERSTPLRAPGRAAPDRPSKRIAP